MLMAAASVGNTLNLFVTPYSQSFKPVFGDEKVVVSVDSNGTASILLKLRSGVYVPMVCNNVEGIREFVQWAEGKKSLNADLTVDNPGPATNAMRGVYIVSVNSQPFRLFFEIEN